MRLKADIELKIRRFFRKYGKTIIIVFVIFSIILVVNKFAGELNKNKTPKTTYKPNVPIMSDTDTVPKKVQKSVEDFIDEYISYCNLGEYNKAYEMISDDCKENYFGTYTDYENYIKKRFATHKEYALQSYSLYNGKYIYSVKLFDDFLATGITNSTYRYIDEKIIASYDENKKIVFSVGGFIDKNEVQCVQENKYLKVDVNEKITFYEFEEYKIKLTNRSDYKIIIQNNEVENTEVLIDLGNESRSNLNTDEIILDPHESYDIIPSFSKSFDNGKTTQSVIFSSIRVVDENNEEIDKFSMTMGF